MLLGEERFKDTIMAVIADFNKKGLSIGSEYYILKDIFHNVENSYYDYVKENAEKVNNEIKQEFTEGLNQAFKNGKEKQITNEVKEEDEN